MPGIPDRQRKPQTMSQQTTDVSQTRRTSAIPQQPSGMPFHRYEPFLPIDLPDRTWPDKRIAEGPALVRRRPARRQPGADRPDEPRPQAARCSSCWCRWATRRSRSASRRASQTDFDFVRMLIEEDLHPRRRRHPGADPGARAPDRAHLRVARGRQAGDRAPVQLDLARCSAGSSSASTRTASSTSPCAAPGSCKKYEELIPDTDVFYEYSPGVLHRHRAGVRACASATRSSTSWSRRRTAR